MEVRTINLREKEREREREEGSGCYLNRFIGRTKPPEVAALPVSASTLLGWLLSRSS
jgi:hypothetical protein